MTTPSALRLHRRRALPMSIATEASPIARGGRVSRQLLQDQSAYDRVFWLTYLANGLTTIANAMMVRYADFVGLIGGGERQLGLIVGVGMLGSIAMRLVLGMGIDRYGAGRVWQWSTIAYCLSLFLHLFLSSAYSPNVFLARILMQTSLAGIFGASITFVSLRVPPQRMAEIIGTLGTSGFIGILLGPLIGDWLFGTNVVRRREVETLFVSATVVAILASTATWFATWRDVVPVSRRPPSLWRLVKRYTSMRVALVSAAMGAGFAIPMTFLRPFAAEMRLSKIGLYFAVYAASAFAARLATRQMFQRFGNRPWIILGMGLLTTSYLLYVPVQQTWHLLAPGAIAGIAHALLFPSVMSAGSTVFPRRYRGIATSLMLAMFDLGAFIGAPVVGAFVQYAKRTDIPAYPAMFAATAGAMLLVTLAFVAPDPRPKHAT